MDAVVNHKRATLAALGSTLVLFLSCSGLVAEDFANSDSGPADAAQPEPDSGDEAPADGGVVAEDGTAAVDGNWLDAIGETDVSQECDTDEHETSLGCVSCEGALQFVASTIESLVQNARTCQNSADCTLVEVSVLPCYQRCPEPVSAKHVTTLSGKLNEIAEGEFCFCADKPWDCVDASAKKIACVGGLCQFLP